MSLSRWEIDERLLAPLRERLAPASPATPPRDLHALRDETVRRVDPVLRAFVEWRETAGAPAAGRLRLSVTFKDVIDVAGFSTRCGSAWYRRYPRRSSPVAACLEQVAVVAGKVQSSEFGLGSRAPCVNPAYPSFSPGGSSTGSAVAVAAGLCDVSVGTDTTVSVRHPAVSCGVVGLRLTPRPGLAAGVMPVSPTLDSLGLVTRTADDLEVLWGAPGLNALRLALGAERVPSGRAPRLGWVTNWQDEPVHPAVAAMWTDVVARLRDAGVALAPVTLSWWRAREQVWPLLLREAADVHGALDRGTGEYSQGVATILERGREVGDREYRALCADQERAEARARVDLAGLDALLLPLDPHPPRSIGEPPPDTVMPAADGAAGAGLGFLEVAAMPRLPALGLPAGTDPSGPPVGLGLFARRGADGVLAWVGAWLERHVRDRAHARTSG